MRWAPVMPMANNRPQKIGRMGNPSPHNIEILTARSEGMSLNATARTFHVSKKSVLNWEHRLAHLKPTLMLYSLVHECMAISSSTSVVRRFVRVNRVVPRNDYPKGCECVSKTRGLRNVQVVPVKSIKPQSRNILRQNMTWRRRPFMRIMLRPSMRR